MGIIDQEGIYHYTSRVAAKEILEQGKLRLSGSHRLNDYFDLKPRFDLAVKDWKGFIEKELLEINLFRKKYLKRWEDRSQREDVINEVKKHFKDEVKKFEHDLTQEINLQIGICCFSKKANTTSQWYHYGDRHMGVVLSFDREKYGLDFSEIKYGVPISQLNEANIMQWLDQNRRYGFINQIINEVFTHKSEDWEKEQELRVIGNVLELMKLGIVEYNKNDGFFYYPFPKEALKSVFLGPKISTEVKDKNGELVTEERLIKIISEAYPHVEIHKITDSASSFTLLTEKVFPPENTP